MYVANDTARDSRVLREADALAGAGHDVVLVARLAAGKPLPTEERRASGVRLVRLPRDEDAVARWRDVQRRARLSVAGTGCPGPRVAAGPAGGPAGWPRAVARALATLVALPWVAYRLRRVQAPRRPAAGAPAVARWTTS